VKLTVMGRARGTTALLLSCAIGLLVAMPSSAMAVPEAERYWLVGERAFQDGLYQLAARMLGRFVDRYPSDPRVPEATLLLGKARFSLKAYVGALEAFTRVASMAIPPGRPDEARFWEAETLFRLKRYQDARGAYERIAADPASPFAADALYGAAWANLETGRPEQAVLHLRRVREAYGDSAVAPAAAYHLGRTLVTLKRPREAIPVLREFKDRYPDHQLIAEARYFHARALIDAGDDQEGTAEMRAFVAAYPGHELAPQAQRALTRSVVRRSDKQDLAEEYKRLMAVKPASAEVLYDAGVVATRLGRTRDAEAAWVRLRKEFPDHALASRASLDLAQLAFTRQQYKEAAALAQSAAKGVDGPARAEAHLLQGESDLKLRRFSSALQSFQAAIRVEGVEAQVRYRALAGSGLAMEEQKQWAQAARYYEEVAAKSPDRTLKAWAKERRAAVGTQMGPPAKAGPARGPQPKGAER
jgi:TolA-binding protein